MPRVYEESGIVFVNVGCQNILKNIDWGESRGKWDKKVSHSGELWSLSVYFCIFFFISLFCVYWWLFDHDAKD